MSSPGGPVPPPIANFPIVDLKTGNPTGTFREFIQKLWAATQAPGGVLAQIATVFGMHGDGTLSAAGVLTVLSSQTRAFVASAFSDTTNASNILTGTLAPALVADESLPQTKLSGLADPVLVSALPAPTAGLRAFVSDSTVAGSGNFGAIVAGGGANAVPVWADNTHWCIG